MKCLGCGTECTFIVRRGPLAMRNYYGCFDCCEEVDKAFDFIEGRIADKIMQEEHAFLKLFEREDKKC